MAELQACGSKVPCIPCPSSVTDSKVASLPGDLGVAPAKVSDLPYYLSVIGTDVASHGKAVGGLVGGS